MKVTSLACIQGAWLPDFNPHHTLDIGAGTGLLTLMAAQKYLGLFHAIEIEDNAYQQLVENVNQSLWSDRIEAFHQDIRDFAKENSRVYDFIITNPPFYQNQFKSNNHQISQARHDISLSMEELISSIIRLLGTQGIVSVLLPMIETKSFIELASAKLLFPFHQLIIHDHPKKPPKAAVTLLSKKTDTIHKAAINIKNERNELSEEYITLLRPYYLNL